jgi:hypothetical protein
MELLSMLMNAKIRDMDGDEIGEVLGVHFSAGRLSLTVDIEGINLEDEDPDDGAKDDIPEDDASNIEFPKIIAMGKMKKDGTDG